MARVPVFYRCWKLTPRPARCRRCGRRILWRITDAAKHLPMNEDAKPIRVDTDPQGRRFEVFEGSASHLWTCLGRALSKRH